MTRSRSAAALAVAAGVAFLMHLGPAAAQRAPMKTGLWEVKSNTNPDGQKVPDMSDQLARMPPEARRKMEEMMRAQGVQMGGGAPGAMRICMNEEMLSGNAWANPQGGCKSEILSRSGDVWRFRTSCAQPPSTAEGETRFQGTEGYTSVVNLTSQRGGKTETTKMTMQGRWLGADCGGLKPLAPPPAAKK